jgi:hypothetical protein
MDFLALPGLAVFTAAVQNGLAFIQHKAVVLSKMTGERFHLFAVQMRQRAAVDAADMHMAFLTGIVLERGGSAAVVRHIAAQAAVLAQLGNGTVDRCFANLHAVFAQSPVRFLCRQAILRTGGKQAFDGFLLFGLISAALRHAKHSFVEKVKMVFIFELEV